MMKCKAVILHDRNKWCPLIGHQDCEINDKMWLLNKSYFLIVVETHCIVFMIVLNICKEL